jgi:hypothetical protein
VRSSPYDSPKEAGNLPDSPLYRSHSRGGPLYRGGEIRMNLIIKIALVSLLVVLGIAFAFIFTSFLMVDAATQGANSIHWMIP